MDVNTNNIYRDVTIDQLSEANVGETKKIAGWIENIRDHGGVSFIDLRDMYGVMQVVMRDSSLLEGLSKEDCISVEGPIEHRDEETYNPKIPTGTIELEAKEVKVLGKTYRQLPFEVMTSKLSCEKIAEAFVISPSTISIFSSSPFNAALLAAIPAISLWISSPVKCLPGVLASMRIGRIPVPVPRSSTFPFFFTLTKEDSRTASIPKQKPSFF